MLLKDIRVSEGRSQIELAKEMGTTQTTISFYECGHWLPPLSFWLKLAKVLKLDPLKVVKSAIEEKEMRDPETWEYINEIFTK